jgi:ATP-dependent helicase HrpB
VSALLDDAPIIRCEGRMHPVETHHMPPGAEERSEGAVVATVLRALDHHDGDILVFLPGGAEIRRVEARLREGVARSATVYALHGSLPQDVQDRAIAPSPDGARKIVLATAIAETSLTIEGVRIVVDGGLMRVPDFSPRTGMARLVTTPVTRDSADQRRGRAGRTSPGVCYRIWTESSEAGLVPHRSPEILQADLAPVALELAAWGVASPDRLRWLDPPPAAGWAQAMELLRELAAVDRHGAITPHGRKLVRPAHEPRTNDSPPAAPPYRAKGG